MRKVSRIGVDVTSSSLSRRLRRMDGTYTDRVERDMAGIELSWVDVLRNAGFDTYAAEILEKTPEDVAKYYATFEQKWHTLAGEISFRVYVYKTRLTDNDADRGPSDRNPYHGRRGKTDEAG